MNTYPKVRDNKPRYCFADLYVTKLEIDKARSYKVIKSMTSSIFNCEIAGFEPDFLPFVTKKYTNNSIT